MSSPTPRAPWRDRLFKVIFEAETPGGKAFDVVLLWAILLSVGAVLLESVRPIRSEFGSVLRAVEWFFTILFTIEYVLRLVSAYRPLGYARSFFGIVDLLSILPTYLSLYIVGSQTLIVIRGLRLLRVFRVFKLARFVSEGEVLIRGLKNSRAKITVFMLGVLSLVLIMGALMYLIEGEKNGFTSIPRSIYWAIVTMTTVGYGDIAPQTVLGQTLASLVMIMGYAIIAVPTGIFSVEIAHAARQANTRSCHECRLEGHSADANFCRRCGSSLNL